VTGRGTVETGRSAEAWGPIDFRRVGRSDFPLLGRWLAEPHVARWWNHESTPEAVERDFGPSVDGTEPNRDYLVLVEGRPIGLIQYSRLAECPEYVAELEPLTPVPDEAVSIDYLIGDPTLVGRGLGTAMLSRFVERIWSTAPRADSIIVPVNKANVASWRALLKVGFRVVARGELEPDNPIDDRQHEILRLDRTLPGDS
jgi:aminoglycoside 6'-N-acetyltransferase